MQEVSACTFAHIYIYIGTHIYMWICLFVCICVEVHGCMSISTSVDV